MANIYKSNYTGAQIDAAIGKVATNEKEITNIKTGYIPLKQFTSGPFQIPQIGYNKELNWIDCNVSISAQSIVQRDGNGIIYINPPDTVPENVNEYAGVNVGYANKTYVKAINVTENTYVYAASSEGPNGRLRVSPTVEGGIIVQTTADATVRTNDPKNVYDAVNLQYLNKNAALLAANNTFIGINTFHKEGTNTHGDKIVSEIKIDPNVTTPYVTVSSATTIGGIPETNKTEIDSTAVTITSSTQFWTKYGIKQIVYGMSSEYNTLDLPDKSGTIALLSDIAGGVTLAGNNTFTGTNVFTSNTLEVSDGIDKTNDGKAVIISSTGIKIYDGAAGRNYTVNFPSYEKGAGSTLATLADLAASSVSTTSDNTFTGNNMFSKPVTVGANADAPGWGTSTVIDGNKIYFCPIGASKTSRYISSEDKFINGTQFIKLFVTATKNSDTDKIYFPDTAGTLALTSDIKIKSASLSGTTLTLTI